MSLTKATTSVYQRLVAFSNAWLFFSFSDKLKFAIKVSLAFVLSYMIPFYFGYSQASTAAMTVMLIATTGGVSASVMKGVIRIIGTIIGAIIGLTLLALFPQDRMTYLIILSIVVPFFLYMYNVYQGDGTVFMLTAMMIMMVFKGGEVDNSFIYGIDRTFMTVLGIVIYTFISVFLWPFSEVDTTKERAIEVSKDQGRYFFNLINAIQKQDESLLLSEKSLQNAYVKTRDDSLDMVLNAESWDNISYEYVQINKTLQQLSLHVSEKRSMEYSEYVLGYDAMTQACYDTFKAIEKGWTSSEYIELEDALHVEYTPKRKALSNLDISSLVGWMHTLTRLQESLRNLASTLNVLNGYSQEEVIQEHSNAAPQFVFLDKEYLKGIVQTFLIYWFSVAFWIYFNPPGGFLIVTLATILSVLTSFSPLKPSVLSILFTLGFVFALLMYVLVLPHIVYGFEAAIFIFMYAFIAFYFINPKLSIFFLIGHATIGLSNTMSYHFDLFLTILLVFYMFLAILMLFHYIPFSSKEEHLFEIMQKRYFNHIATLLENKNRGFFQKKLQAYHALHLRKTLMKLKLWGSKIDMSYFSKNSKEEIALFVAECELLSLKVLTMHDEEKELRDNNLFTSLQALTTDNQLVSLARVLENRTYIDVDTYSLDSVQSRAEELLESYKEQINLDVYSSEVISEVLNYIAIRHSCAISLHQCLDKIRLIDWDNLKRSRF